MYKGKLGLVWLIVSSSLFFFVILPNAVFSAAEPNPDKKGDECKKKADEAKKQCDKSKQKDKKACEESKKDMYKDSVKIDAKTQNSEQTSPGQCVPKEGCQKAKRSHSIDVAGGGSKQCDKCMDSPGAGNEAVKECMKEEKGKDQKKEDPKKEEEKKGDEKKGEEGKGEPPKEMPKAEPPKEEPKKKEEEPKKAEQPCTPGSQGTSTNASGQTSANPCPGQTQVAQKTEAEKALDRLTSGVTRRLNAGQQVADIEAFKNTFDPSIRALLTI